MTDDVKGERKTEEEEACKGRGHNPKGEMQVRYADGSIRSTGRGIPLYGGLVGPTRPPMAYPPTYDLISKKRRRIYSMLLLTVFLLMFFGGIAGEYIGVGGGFAQPGPGPLLLLVALVGFLGIVFYGIPLAWKGVADRRKNPSPSLKCEDCN